MKTAATIQVALICLALMIGALHSQPIPLGIFYNLQHGATVTQAASTACVSATGTLDFTNSGNNCNLIWYILLF